MKQFLILIAAFMLASLVSNAQTEKGNQTFGINLGYQSNKNSMLIMDAGNPASADNINSKITNFNIGPNYSYFIADKLDIGASLLYSLQNFENDDMLNPGSSYKQHMSSYGGTIHIRKYFMYKDKIGLRAGPYVGYFRADNKYTYPSNNTYNSGGKTDNYEAGMNLDLVYYPSKSLGISASLANLTYTHYKANNGPQGTGSGDNVDLSFINNGLSLSVFYVFGDK